MGGVILFLIDGGVPNLFSWRAAAFLGIGMFAAAIVVGGISYLIIRTLADRLMMRYGDPASVTAQRAMRKWRSVVRLLNLALAVLLVLCAYAVFRSY